MSRGHAILGSSSLRENQTGLSHRNTSHIDPYGDVATDQRRGRHRLLGGKMALHRRDSPSQSLYEPLGLLHLLVEMTGALKEQPILKRSRAE